MLIIKTIIIIFLSSFTHLADASVNLSNHQLEKIIMQKMSSKNVSPKGWDLGPYQWGPDLTYITEGIWRSRLQEVRLGQKDYIFEEFYLRLRLGGFYYLGIGKFVVKKYKIIYEKINRKNRFGHLIPLIFKGKKT